MTTLNTTTTTLAQVQISQVIEQLNDYDTEALINIYNQYADAMSYERIYDNDETTLNEVFSTPYDAIKQTNNFLYKDHENYFTFNGYGHAISFDYSTDDNCPIDIEELAQWISNNELYNDFDIEVTTLDDMLASIEDNITDDENMLKTAINYLGVSTMYKGDDKMTDYNQYLIDSVMDEIRYTNYETIKGVIDRLGIDYK